MEHVLKALENAADLEEKYQQKLFTYEELKEKEEREVADVSTTKALNLIKNPHEEFSS